jgi:hypothetical protein
MVDGGWLNQQKVDRESIVYFLTGKAVNRKS